MDLRNVMFNHSTLLLHSKTIHTMNYEVWTLTTVEREQSPTIRRLQGEKEEEEERNRLLYFTG